MDDVFLRTLKIGHDLLVVSDVEVLEDAVVLRGERHSGVAWSSWSVTLTGVGVHVTRGLVAQLSEPGDRPGPVSLVALGAPRSARFLPGAQALLEAELRRAREVIASLEEQLEGLGVVPVASLSDLRPATKESV